jgi:Domain of unknown function (DUF4157)
VSDLASARTSEPAHAHTHDESTTSAARSRAGVTEDPGAPLDSAVRTDMEHRFGTDFSQVRVHTDPGAAGTARRLRAAAYTVGNHISFSAGQYAPGGGAGRKLLAHELAHIVQQRGSGAESSTGLRVTDPTDSAERAAVRAADTAMAGGRPRVVAGSARPAIARDTYEAQRGTSVVRDEAEIFSQGSDSVFEATMRRTQYRTQAEADQAAQGQTVPLMGLMLAKVRFDAANRRLTIPVNVQTRGAVPSDIDPAYLNHPQRIPTQVDPGLVRRVGAQYIAACNTALNGWYELEMGTCGRAPCAGGPIPIRVEVRESSSNPDFTVVVSNLSGRSNVDTLGMRAGTGRVMLYAGGLDRTTMAHEGAHVALGVEDEYHETDARFRRQAPVGTGIERERDDWSLAGSHHDYARLVLLHERHFSHVPVFMRQVLTALGHPNCRPALRALRRPVVPEFYPSMFMGYTSYGGRGYGVGLGFDVGLGLNRTREWQALLGVHGQMLTGLSEGSRLAFLAGARAGLQVRVNPVRGGMFVGGFGELGLTGEAHGRPLAPFASGGGRLGWDFGRGALGGQLGIEAAGGVRIDAEAYRWYRIGLSAGLSF